MNIYVDDLRQNHAGFTLARTYDEAIKLIEENKNSIDILSLDHDLADIKDGVERTGYTICLYLLEHQISPREIFLHTDNAVGRFNMQSLLEGGLRREFIKGTRVYLYPCVPNIY